MKFFTVEERKKLLVEGLSRIVEVIKEENDPERIIVFGSMAGRNIHGAPRASPWSPQNHTHLRPWALERFGAQAPRLRWVIRR